MRTKNLHDSSKLCTADLHLHTNLSRCAPADSTLLSYLEACKAEGIKKIGISNHLYSDLGVSHTLKIRDEIEQFKNCYPIEILAACEAEVFYGKKPQLSKKDASKFDYVLLSPSHIFNILEMYSDFDLSTSDKIRQLILDNFKYACQQEFGVPTAIAHPLYPICAPNQQEILDGMTDNQLGECYTLAAQTQKSIEIHACLYRNTVELDSEGLSPTYIRMLSIAKECGCQFHFGSDAHEAKYAFLGVHNLLELAAKRAGITENNLWPLARL